MQAGVCPGRKPFLQTQLGTCAQHADLSFYCVGTEFFQGRRAYASAWRIDDTKKSRIIIRIRQQAQIGNDVPDLTALEERNTAADYIGNIHLPQIAFKHTRLEVAAVKNCVITITTLMLELV